jgi:predicted O-linked N-acetylglucosamine transferase (SPINDLY family)
MFKSLLRIVRRSPATPDLAGIATGVRNAEPAALVALDDYLSHHPHDPHARALRAQARLAADRLDGVVDDLEFAHRYDPQDPVIRANLGLALWRMGDADHAVPHLEAAVAHDPVPAGAVLTLASARAGVGDMAGAAADLRAALSRAPIGTPAELAGLWIVLAGLAPYVPDIDAVDCFAQAARANPGSALPDLLAFMPRAERCDWRVSRQGLIDLFEHAAREGAPAAFALPPGFADCVPISRAARRQAARTFAAGIAARVPDVALEPARPRADGVIRLGYLSADLHHHPTLQLLRGVLRHHDRARFELYAYSYGPEDHSPLRAEAMTQFKLWRELRGASVAETARLIAQDGIEILVDLKGFTGGVRAEVAALRPAPVQVSYLGYPGTMGAPWIDYLIADRVIIPPGEEAWYDEQVVILPHSYQPNDDEQADPVPLASRVAADLPDEGVVYCCFNAPYKFEPMIFSAWMRILAAVPGSVLWLLCDREDARANLRREAESRGIAPSRLHFAASLPKPAHLARLPLADLFLDTHYVNAHTTASDALWMGLPLITVPGESFSSRVAASLLHATGLADLVCPDIEAYVALAIALGHDAPRREALRERARASRRAPLFDTRSYTRSLERAYELMRERAAAGDAPAAFCVRET